MNEKTTTIGKYLKAIRDAAGLTLRAVEEKTGVSNAFLSQIESGKVKQPSPAVLHKLADTFGVPYDTLMEKAGYPTPSGAKSPRTPIGLFQRFGRLSQEEEDALLEYLTFIRSRSQRGRGKA
jgi:transcriptional regulator with XRE-family HTH domain